MPAASRGQHIAVLGAGSWGTALAIHLARAELDVCLWGNDPAHIERLHQQRSNQQFLPGVEFPASLCVEARLEVVLGSAAWVLLAIPSHAFRPFLHANAQLFNAEVPVAWASKGLEQGTAKLLHEVVSEEIPQCQHLAVISGPTFAKEVAANLPTAITVASNSDEFASVLTEALHSGRFRVYVTDDITGVELGGAVKNVLAIAAGAADGLGFGANARTALITRGLAEMMRLGEAMGGRRETFMGLAGMGDLVLTCTDDQSRNRRMGLLLAQGKTEAEIRQLIGQEIEGVKTAQEVKRLAEKYHIDMPITRQVYRVLYQGVSPQNAVRELLNRDSTNEF
ncbi:MAG: NAD(P)H-dependent glycerol-3-phosphate dehydrogenase [Gammaproteobacteria bacterium]